MIRTTLAGPLALFALAGCATLPAPASPPQTDASGMVSAADPRAAAAGVEILRAGGSATDAAIATMLALTVVEPQSSGIGGGGFYVRGAADGTVETIDGRETAPAGADGQWFLDPQGKPLPFRQAVVSGLSVGVPGNLALAEEAHRRHGKLAWSALFAPAIALARGGFAITERLHDSLAANTDSGAHDADGRALFYAADGNPLPVGTRVRNPQLAVTLQTIANGGATAFYHGDLADAVAREVAAATPRPAQLSADDLAAYRAKWREPVCGTYRSYRICGMGPPSSGATTVFAILKQLERFDLGKLGPQSPTFWHLFAESQRLAYADRAQYLADPDFIAVPTKGLVNGDYLARRGLVISSDRTMPTPSAGNPPGAPLALGDGDEPEEHGTSHFAVTDRWGDAVSYTSTIESPFGSGIVAGGFYLNNELTDFSFSPRQGDVPVANRVEGAKRPRSSMSPTVVYDARGQLVLAVGAAGGATIPVQTAKNIIAVIDFGLPVQQALALPVLFAPGDTIFVEQGTVLAAMIPQLVALGHANTIARGLPLKANAVQWTGMGWTGAADPRSEGVAIGQ